MPLLMLQTFSRLLTSFLLCIDMHVALFTFSRVLFSRATSSFRNDSLSNVRFAAKLEPLPLCMAQIDSCAVRLHGHHRDAQKMLLDHACVINSSRIPKV